MLRPKKSPLAEDSTSGALQRTSPECFIVARANSHADAAPGIFAQEGHPSKRGMNCATSRISSGIAAANPIRLVKLDYAQPVVGSELP